MGTREAFYKVLLRRLGSEESASIHLGSVAAALGVSQGLLTRYLNEAREAVWLTTEGSGTKITILNRKALEDAAGSSQEVESRG